MQKGLYSNESVKRRLHHRSVGQPTSVINASAYGAIKTALENDSITRVLGALNGIKGVLDDNLIDMGKDDLPSWR